MTERTKPEIDFPGGEPPTELEITDEIKAELNQSLKEFGETFAAGRKTAAA